MNQKATILEAAVDKGRRTLTPEQAGEEILKLLRQIGVLENRNADLETGIKAVSAKCYWRTVGYCDLGCGGRVFCDTSGLKAFDWGRVDGLSPAHPKPAGEKGGHTGPPLRGDAERSAG